MKKLFLLLLISAHLSSYSQTNLVQVIASGEGKTKDESLNAALRHCIEKTFGVFVSTNTTVSNDSLIKDDIATVASGSIASYDVISEMQNNGLFIITVSAQVSPEKVVKIMKSKGHEFEVNGEVYAQNVIKDAFYQEQEVDAVNNFFKVWSDIQLFDFDIKVGEPYSAGDGFFGTIYNDRYHNTLSYSPTSENFSVFKDELNKIFYGDKQAKLPAPMQWNGKDYVDNKEVAKCYSGSLRFNAAKTFDGNLIAYNDYRSLSKEQEDSMKKDYLIPILFIPHPNENYTNFVKACIKLFTSLSVEDSQLRIIIETAKNLDKPDLNTFKAYVFNLRNPWNFRLGGNLLSKSTALNFTESNINSFKYPPLIFISETNNDIFYDHKIVCRNFPVNMKYGTPPRQQLIADACTFDPSILLIRLTYDELKTLKRFNFQIKHQDTPLFKQYFKRS